MNKKIGKSGKSGNLGTEIWGHNTSLSVSLGVRQGSTVQIVNTSMHLALPVLLGGIRLPPGATAGLPSSAILDRRQLFDFSPAGWH
jgi:hypothetical protein